MIRNLQPLEIENIEINYILWTNQNSMTAISPVEPLNMLFESCFQLEQNGLKQLILLQGVQIPQEAEDKLSSLLVKDYDRTVFYITHGCRKNNILPIDIFTAGPPIAWKPYQIPLKYQKFVD